ncbi:hypothetical protein B0T22DRAFT_58986 [Podospora appendiculata]|uniref:Septation protein SUN4 n=1 Tax=Podospora appendiculata TaxID=314037 RepID=A0AAE0XIR2_9PEZI|nr:hypothetical protein B0T22DRAFT_58986 [Podospora appendiculata]
MQGIIRVAFAAAVVASVTAQPHNHNHRHRHVKKQSPIEQRDAVVVTEVVQGPTVVAYVLDGKTIEPSKAEQGISEGLYVVMGSTKPSFSAPPPSFSTSVVSSAHGGQFKEQKVTSISSSAAPSPTPTSSESSAPPASSSSAPASAPVGGSIDADFPSGKLKCDSLPTEYGAVPIEWLGTNGWTTLQKVGKWIDGVSVDNIVSPTNGGCEPGMMCSYACPPGYQKTQWPENSQGATGQSVGGLYCNDAGYLVLTRPSHSKICEPGAGGVFVKNSLSGSASVCRTDYPGNEAMTIPVVTTPGSTYPLTNPLSSTYYKWQNKPTTAQYYVNNKDVSVEQACTWTSSVFPSSAGNWAPTCIGVGKDDNGITYLSIFPNLPTSHAVLDFDIEITGDISGECWLKSGQYSGNNGCTVGIREGGTATINFKNSGS